MRCDLAERERTALSVCARQTPSTCVGQID
jgi:hypothetical protein